MEVSQDIPLAEGALNLIDLLWKIDIELRELRFTDPIRGERMRRVFRINQLVKSRFDQTLNLKIGRTQFFQRGFCALERCF